MTQQRPTTSYWQQPEVDALKAENERLREALRDIAHSDHASLRVQVFAGVALRTTPPQRGNA